jgi:hypothetical protein
MTSEDSHDDGLTPKERAWLRRRASRTHRQFAHFLVANLDVPRNWRVGPVVIESASHLAKLVDRDDPFDDRTRQRLADGGVSAIRVPMLLDLICRQPAPESAFASSGKTRRKVRSKVRREYCQARQAPPCSVLWGMSTNGEACRLGQFP